MAHVKASDTPGRSISVYDEADDVYVCDAADWRNCIIFVSERVCFLDIVRGSTPFWNIHSSSILGLITPVEFVCFALAFWGSEVD